MDRYVKSLFVSYQELWPSIFFFLIFEYHGVIIYTLSFLFFSFFILKIYGDPLVRVRYNFSVAFFKSFKSLSFFFPKEKTFFFREVWIFVSCSGGVWGLCGVIWFYKSRVLIVGKLMWWRCVWGCFVELFVGWQQQYKSWRRWAKIMGDSSLLTCLSMENHHPSTLLSMDSSASEIHLKLVRIW